MPYLDLKTYSLYYEEYSPSEDALKSTVPIVFLHGFSLDRRMWQRQVEFFRRRYRVIVFDSRGHGLSGDPPTDYSRAHRVEELKQLVDYLQIERFHLVGLSMGGSTGIGFALTYQNRLASLTLASTSAAGYQAGKKLSMIDRIAREHGVEAARQKWKEVTLSWYPEEKRQIKEFLEQMMDDYSGAVWRDPQRGKYPKEEDLPRVHAITIPTLILTGELDHIFFPLSTFLRERIPHSRLVVFPGVGHMINLEAPDKFNEEVAHFLENIGTST